ncbi:MAG: Amuc_1100 family pilus-like protein [Verrucomicrobiota bacterium]|nr:Amuc_1100 family pilus-like protein [Verrucomicrobiota bacterium]
MKTNIFVIIGAATVAVLVAVAAFLLYGEIERFNSVKGDVDSAMRTLRNFYRNKPFPSLENVERERKNAQVCADWRGRLTDDLRQGEIKVVQVSPAILLTLLSDAKKELVQEAEKHGAALPPRFEFGFEKYAGGIMPSPTDVMRLNEQLLIVQAVCRAVFEEGAAALTRVAREEFEEQKTPGALETSGRRHAAREPAKAEAKTAEKVVYTRQSFALDFKAKESSVVRILNRLAKLGAFTVVTFLDAQNEWTGVKPSPAQAAEEIDVAAAGRPSARTPAAKPDGADKAEEKVPARLVWPQREDRVVSGPTLEKPLQARMNVTVYKFEPARGRAKAGETTP